MKKAIVLVVFFLAFTAIPAHSTDRALVIARSDSDAAISLSSGIGYLLYRDKVCVLLVYSVL